MNIDDQGKRTALTATGCETPAIPFRSLTR